MRREHFRHLGDFLKRGFRSAIKPKSLTCEASPPFRPDRLRWPIFVRQRIQPEQRPIIGAFQVLVQAIQEALSGGLVFLHHVQDQRPGQNLAAGVIRPPALDEQVKLARLDLLLPSLKLLDPLFSPLDLLFNRRHRFSPTIG